MHFSTNAIAQDNPRQIRYLKVRDCTGMDHGFVVPEDHLLRSKFFAGCDDADPRCWFVRTETGDEAYLYGVAWVKFIR